MKALLINLKSLLNKEKKKEKQFPKPAIAKPSKQNTFRRS